ncbi:MAG: hypothetical protein E3J76_04600 [Candidatus Aminicenantes bacterium]|nr:MAG: hypothetical protein E3J76_04600 [Candidatus Aminicenantes bacterium]
MAMKIDKGENPKHRDFVRKITLLSKEELSNQSEEEFRRLCAAKDLRTVHKGFPDFMIFDARGEFKGFVEIKRRPGEELRFPQKLFRRLCRERRVPYFIWERGKDAPSGLFE